MITQVFQVDPLQPDPVILQQAGRCLRSGGLVAFPTETVYGLGANALDANAVERIFAAKNRPTSDPIIVHIAALDQLALVAQNIPPLAYMLAERFWAGALTLVLARGEAIPSNVSAGLATVAVRMPSHPIALALIRAAGVPIAAPSANTFARPSATTAAHVLEDLNERIEMILDGGAATIGIESTVLDLTVAPPAILRPGGVTLEALRDVIPQVEVKPRYLGAETPAQSPGMMLKHYSPRAELILFTGDAEQTRTAMRQTAQERLRAGQKVGLLIVEADQPYFADLPLEIFSLGAGMADIGGNLFAGLRALDGREVGVILAREVTQEGLGLAVWDRLVRAAEGRVINCNS